MAQDSKRYSARSLIGLLGLLALGAAADARPAVSQDSQYWSEQYGTRAALLGGAMIGSVRDLSAVYYNPGALALQRDAGFLLSARAYRSTTLTLEDAGGEGRDLASSSTRPIATFLATPLEIGFLGNHVLVYSVLTRQHMDFSTSDYQITQADRLPAPGEEYLAGAYNGSASLRETWTGLAWAYPLTERLGIGVAPYLAVRSHDIGSSLLVQAASEAADVAIGVRLRSRRYTHYRLLAKLGLLYERGPLSVGFSATTPSIALKGDGRAVYNGSAASTDPDGLAIEAPSLTSSVQADLASDYRSGLTLGTGLGWTIGGTRIHASAEWFEGVERFTALDADDFVPQTGGEVLVNDMTVEYRSMFNWGIGVEQNAGGSQLFASVSTDNSAANPGAPVNTDATLTAYDLLRVGGGASFSLGRADIMVGLAWAAGRSPFLQLFDLTDLDPGFDLDDLDETDLELSQWSVVVGFEWRPLQDVEDEGRR
jgi:hypothetical protein